MGQSFDDIVAIFYQYQQICRSTAQMAMTYSRQKMIIEAATYYVCTLKHLPKNLRYPDSEVLAIHQTHPQTLTHPLPEASSKNPTIFNRIPWIAGSMGRSSH